MKKITTVCAVLCAVLLLAGCGSRVETRKLAGTWQYRMDISEELNRQMAEALELDEIQLGSGIAVYLSLTVAEDGAYTLSVDTEATGAELYAYMQALAPVLTEAMYAAAESEGMTREEFDTALTEMGMSAEDYIAAILGAFDMNALLDTMVGEDTTAVSSGCCKAEDGRLYMADDTQGLTADADYVTYTLNSDGTMQWNDAQGELSRELTEEELELIRFPMVWTKQTAEAE